MNEYINAPYKNEGTAIEFDSSLAGRACSILTGFAEFEASGIIALLAGRKYQACLTGYKKWAYAGRGYQYEVVISIEGAVSYNAWLSGQATRPA